MADFSALKSSIQSYIKQNGNEEITGTILQDILLAMVQSLGDSAINGLVSDLESEATARQNADGTLTNSITAINNAISNGMVYAGIATPTGTPASGKVFYIALQAGTYTNFGNKTLTQGINILKYNGSSWTLEQIIGFDDYPTANSQKLVKSGGVDAEIKSLVGYYTCGTAAATAEKTITSSTYILLQGGAIKVMFTYANTAADATLKIGSADAKPLYYAGRRAGSSNSWLAGEVVEIFYDGTNYYANSVAGGNGSGDGAFDISVYNGVGGTPTQYAGFSAAVTNANVPEQFRKGGMTVRFIDSTTSPSKYVQYRLMKTTWSRTITDWQGIDDVPTAGSENLVKSGGISVINGSFVVDGTYNNVTEENYYIQYNLPNVLRAGTKLYVVSTGIGIVVSTIRITFATGQYIDITSNNAYVTVPVDCNKIFVSVASLSWILQSGGNISTSIYVKGLVPIDFKTGQHVEDVSIVNDLQTTGLNNVLCAEQGKVLDEKISLTNTNDKDFSFTTTRTNQRITALDNMPAGSRIYRFADNVNGTFRYYYTKNGTDGYKDIKNGDTLIIGADGETLRYFAVVQNNTLIHLLLSPTDYDTENNPLLYDTVSIKNLIGHNKVFGVEDLEVSTTSSTNIYDYAPVAKIPKGSVVHIDFADSFSSWLTEYRLYINQASSYTAQKKQHTTFVADVDITSIRVSIANGKIISGQTPPNISVEMWWEDVRLQFEQVQEKLVELEPIRQITDVSKQSFIDANPSGYDSTNDKFTEGVYTIVVSNSSNKTALSDVIANYVAKYTSSGDAYPYIQLNYNYTASSNWWKYPIGGKGHYKFGQCKCIFAGTQTFGSPWTDDIKMIITVPAGCELYIKNINAEYADGFVNKNAFKVYQHGTERNTTGADNRSNWDLWPRIGNYGAIVIPKRTTDGRWVCYHDDSFSSNQLQVIGNPSAALPAASMQACTFDQTQTLEYKTTNFYGDHDTIPTLEEFFAKCAQMGVHPALSCHPISSVSTGWTVDKWGEVKTLAKKYRVLDKLTIKCSYNIEAIRNFYNIFGDDIESYIADVSSNPTQETIEELANVGWNLNKVKVGFEILATTAYFSDATIALFDENNLIHGIAPGASGDFYRNAKNLKDIVEKGCYEITADQFYSNGLNWG